MARQRNIVVHPQYQLDLAPFSLDGCRFGSGCDLVDGFANCRCYVGFDRKRGENVLMIKRAGTFCVVGFCGILNKAADKFSKKNFDFAPKLPETNFDLEKRFQRVREVLGGVLVCLWRL